MKGALSTTTNTTRHLQLQLGQVSLIPLQQPSSTTATTSSAVSCFQNLLDAEAPNASSSRVALIDNAAAAAADDRDCILSQDFFWYYSSSYPFQNL